MSHVYASLPLTGPGGAAGRDVLRGAELALERDPRLALIAVDTAGEDRDGRALAVARRAAEDPRALAYLGDFHSSQVQATAPVLSAAGLLQVSPAATFAGLRGATLVRLMPDDRQLADAIARWLAAAGVCRVLVVHDHDEGYGVPLGGWCAEAARERGLDARARPVWDHDEELAADVGDVEAVLYAGVAGSGAVGLWNGLHALDPRLWLLGTDGVAAPWLASALSPSAAERTRFFGSQRAPWGLYGLEAMSLILDATSAAGDRAGAVRAARGSRARDSVLGRYSIDDDGRTTLAQCGRLAVVDGELVWDSPTRSAG